VQPVTHIDPASVIALRVVMMLFFGVALPQLAGLLVTRVARWTPIIVALGAVIPGVIFTAAVLFALQMSLRVSEARGIREVCLTPVAATLLLGAPVHCLIGIALQTAFRRRAVIDEAQAP
jgi:hypothetical protein